MPDREKVLLGLKYCGKGCNYKCPYWHQFGFGDDGCTHTMRMDALELLKEQETVEHALDILRKNGWKEERTCEKCTLLTAVSDGVHDMAKQFRKVGEVE